MDLGLNGKTALVLGGSKGLGRAVALALAGEGARVAVAGRDQQALADVSAAVIAAGTQALALTWDLGALDTVDQHVTHVEEALGPVDILINNTGGPPLATAAGQDPALWRTQFERMVLSVITITDRVLPGMRARRWGRIITSTSSGVTAPIPNLAISNTLRSSLVGWSKTLAREVARDGVTANIVVPGRIATARLGFIDGQRAEREKRPVEEITAESASAIPMGRPGDPSEYADVVAFLASTRSAYVTGSIIRVDGGQIASI